MAVCRWVARLALLSLGLVVPLVVVEAALRLFGPVLPGNYNTGSFLTTHPTFGRFHVLGFDGWVKTSEYTSRITINSLGLRGRERTYAKPDGVRRVLVLGDSFVEGAQVHDSQGLVSRLEETLNETEPGRYEVLNGGVGGWGTGQQYVFLANEGYRYEPDLVLIVLYLGNDIYDNSYQLQGRPKNPHEPYFVFEDDGSLRQLDFRVRKSEDVDPTVALLRSRTLLWNVFETGVLAKLEEEGEDTQELRLNRFNLNKMGVYSNDPNERQLDAWKVTLALVERIRAFADDHGAATGLVVVPASWQVYDGEWNELIEANKLKPSAWSSDFPNQYLAQRAATIQTPMLDLLPALRGAGEHTSASLYFSSDKHWTADGHAVAAREVAAFLASSGLLSSDRLARQPGR